MYGKHYLCLSKECVPKGSLSLPINESFICTYAGYYGWSVYPKRWVFPFKRCVRVRNENLEISNSCLCFICLFTIKITLFIFIYLLYLRVFVLVSIDTSLFSMVTPLQDPPPKEYIVLNVRRSPEKNTQHIISCAKHPSF